MIVIGIAVVQNSRTDSFQIGHTFGTFAPLPGLLQSGQQHCSQNGDNCNYNEKFDQRKNILFHKSAFFIISKVEVQEPRQRAANLLKARIRDILCLKTRARQSERH